jgi:histidinol phosphatase-like PHP family hydrolase
VDYHVHLDNSTLDAVLELSARLGVRFGIVEHAGTKENQYPVVLSNDRELLDYVARFEGKPAWKGVQAEWKDWMTCFSREALSRLDYVLTDAMTFPGKDGRRVKLWEPQAPEHVDFTDAEAFMDRYVEWHVEIMSRQPIDLFANLTWLPAPFMSRYDALWTPARMRRIVDAALAHGVAFEISSSFKVPRLPFLRMARDAGIKLAFGSNGRYPNMGKLEYSLALARDLGLKPADLFSPAPDGKKAVQRRTWTP